MKDIPKKPLVRLVNKANTQGALKVNLPSVVIESLNLKLDDYVEFIIEDGAVKIKKCTDFATQNIVARVVKNAGTSNALEYICEIIR